jgi:hypothetical protein
VFIPFLTLLGETYVFEPSEQRYIGLVLAVAVVTVAEEPSFVGCCGLEGSALPPLRIYRITLL